MNIDEFTYETLLGSANRAGRRRVTKWLATILRADSSGGYATALAESFISVLQLEDDVRFVGGSTHAGIRTETQIQETADVLNSLRRRDRTTGSAFLLSGARDPSTGRTGGHAVALVYDGYDLTLYNHGKADMRKSTLFNYLKTYPMDTTTSMFEFKLPRRNLQTAFSAVASPPKSPSSVSRTKQRRCPNGSRRDRRSGECIKR